MFGGQNLSESEGMFLVCNVISKDRMIKWPYDFKNRTLLMWVSTLQNLVAIGFVVVEI